MKPETGIVELITERCLECQDQIGKASFFNLESSVVQLAKYLQLLDKWTEKVDLVSPAPLEVLTGRHIVDIYAAFLVMHSKLDIVSGRWVDVGSGAGLPGVILAILNPNLQITLLEPREKRVVFLKEVKMTLKLDNIEIVRKRCEDYLPEKKDISVAISRGLGDMQLLVNLVSEFGKNGSLAIEMAGKPVTDCNFEQYNYYIGKTKAFRSLKVFHVKHFI